MLADDTVRLIRALGISCDGWILAYWFGKIDTLMQAASTHLGSLHEPSKLPGNSQQRTKNPEKRAEILWRTSDLLIPMLG